MQLIQLLQLHGIGRAGQRVGGVLHLGEGDHVPDAAGAADQHCQSIETVGKAAVRRRAVFESIEQEVVVLFDEFDKTFDGIKVSENSASAQASMLSLFDGMSTGKKLFVITCNSLSGMNEYLLNRPGRFHYHFRFNYPTADEIREYLQDKLDKQYWEEIDKVISFSQKVDLNYDCLRAIAFELNMGDKFENAIQDLK